MDRRKALKVIGLGTAALAAGVPPAAPTPPPTLAGNGLGGRERFMPGCSGGGTLAHVRAVCAGAGGPLEHFLPRYTFCVEVPPGMDLTPGTHLRVQHLGFVPGRSTLMRIEAVWWGEVLRKNGKSTLAAPPIELPHLRRAFDSLRADP